MGAASSFASRRYRRVHVLPPENVPGLATGTGHRHKSREDNTPVRLSAPRWTGPVIPILVHFAISGQ